MELRLERGRSNVDSCVPVAPGKTRAEAEGGRTRDVLTAIPPALY